MLRVIIMTTRVLPNFQVNQTQYALFLWCHIVTIFSVEIIDNTMNSSVKFYFDVLHGKTKHSLLKVNDKSSLDKNIMFMSKCILVVVKVVFALEIFSNDFWNFENFWPVCKDTYLFKETKRTSFVKWVRSCSSPLENVDQISDLVSASASYLFYRLIFGTYLSPEWERWWVSVSVVSFNALPKGFIIYLLQQNEARGNSYATWAKIACFIFPFILKCSYFWCSLASYSWVSIFASPTYHGIVC